METTCRLPILYDKHRSIKTTTNELYSIDPYFFKFLLLIIEIKIYVLYFVIFNKLYERWKFIKLVIKHVLNQ